MESATTTATVSTTAPKTSSKVSYLPQMDEDDEFGGNSQEGYMMLVPVRKKPILQAFFVFTSMVLAVAALIRDEIMDGNLTFAYTSYWYNKLKEVDYDCGYQQLRFVYKYKGGYQQSESYKYGSSICQADEYIFSTNFCKDQDRLGKVWLACSIIGIICNAVSLIGLYKHGHRSKIYLIYVILSIIFYGVAAFDWLANERCSDMENFSNASMTLDTTIGSSLALMIVAFGLCVFGMLLSLLHLIKHYTKSKEQLPIPLATTITTQNITVQ